MRRPFITLCVAMILALSFGLAFAAANHRSALDRKAKRVVEWQEKQDTRFKALEKESKDLLKKFEGDRCIIKPVR